MTSHAAAAEVSTDERLDGRHAVVTGGGRGIGAAIARELARLGASVSILGRNKGRLDDHAKRVSGDTGGNVASLVCDITREASVRDTFARARERFGPIGILVNNAGQAVSAPIGETSLETWNQLIAVNLTGSFLCCREVIPGMVAAAEGRIVNVASTSALKGYARLSAYTAAKHGVLGLTRSLATEVGKHGVTVNAVCPGYTNTDMAESAVKKLVDGGKSVTDARAIIAKSNPRGTLIEPDEVATTVAWLCSAAARSVTGQAIVIAGGDVR